MPSLPAQLAALTRKNLLILGRSPIQLLLVLLSPLIALFIAIASGGALAASFKGAAPASVSTTDPPVLAAALAKCTSPTGCPASTPRVFWAPAGQDAYHAKVMENLAAELDLKVGVDVIGLPSLDELAKTAIDRQAAVLAERPVNFALAFTTFVQPKSFPSLPIPPPTANSTTGGGPRQPSGPNPLLFAPLLAQFQQPPTFSPPVPAGDMGAAKARVASVNGTHYTLWPMMQESFTFVDTVLPNIAIDSKPILFKHHLDQAIVRTRAEMEGAPAPTLKVSLSHFPLPKDVSNDPFSGSGGGEELEKAKDTVSKRLGNSFTASFMILGFCPLLLVMSNMVGNEKNTGLISNLRKLGMSELAYWLSTYLTASLLILASSLIALLAIPAFPESFQLFTWRADVLLSVYLITGLHMTAVGLLIVASLNSAYAANMLCGFLCMACIIVAAIFGFNDSIYLMGADLAGGAGAAKAQALAKASMWHSMFDPPVKGWLMSVFLPFMPMGKVFTELSTYLDVGAERTRGAVTWANAGVYVSRTFEEYDRTARAKYTYSTVSTQATMLSTLALVAATFAVSVYINQVVGGPYPLWFPFTPAYWGLGQDGDEKLNAEAEREQALVVRNLKKSFTTGIVKRRTVKAVKDVSLTVRKGRVLALLGTNGAGKSTSIGMITGLFRPDAGAVSVFGTANLGKIQQTIGVVTQSDITWPLLTAAEHVQLYAAFKSKVECSPEYVTDRLTQVGLEGNAEGKVGTFSGGMRKRLCVVLCSIGEPPLCILDEPTSSLDPINRLKVHKFIQTLKSHAAVILTTHLLDEADSLGDEICIIDDGKVKATGSSLALKSKYGSGYEVTLLTNGHVSLADMRDLVCTYAPEATLVQRSTDMFSATIPKSSPVTPLVRFLRSDDPQRVALVQGWEISNETLEQVFLTVAEQAKAERDAAAGVSAADGAANDGDLQPFELPKFTSKKSLPHQIAAVMAKDWAFQMRQPKATIATFVLVILVLFGYVKLLDLARETVCPGGYAAVRRQTTGDPMGDPSLATFEETCDLSVPRQQFIKSAGACVPGLNVACVVGDFRLPSGYQGGSSTGARYWVQGDGAAADQLLANTNAPLWSLVPLFGREMNVSAPSVRKMTEDPVAVIKSNVQRMASAAQPVPAQCKFRVAYDEEAKIYQGDKNVDPKVEFDGLMPDYAVKINSFSAQSSDIHIVVPLLNYGSQQYLSIARPAANGSSCLVVKPVTYAPTAQQVLNQFLSSTDPESIRAISMSSIDGKLYELLQGTTVAQLRAVTRTNEGVFANLRNVPTVSAPRAIPALITFLMPMSFYVLFFSYLLLPFYEKEARLFEFYRVNGLSVAACWLGHYLFALSLTLPSLVASTIIVAVYIPTASIVSYLLLTLIAIHGSISMAFLLAGILSSVTMARLISFLFPPVATVISASLLITGDTPSFLASLLFPPLPYAHGLRSIVVTATPKWGLSLAGFVMSTVYLVLAIALMTLTDKSPFAILKSKVVGLIRGDKSSTRPAAGHSQQPLVDVEDSAADADGEDDEVRREREMLLAGGKEADGLAVKAVGLNKSFGSHQVLKDMNLAIAPGLTFGLLGANGCGKSTFLSIVMGSARPTSGNVWVGGKLSTTRDLSSIIGVCPQADLLIGDLTVEENLQFFARLRGAALWGQELERLVSRCIELVGLKEAKHRAAHALSGGMKRRLSMGIAVIGSPQLILADEPSQGLDAANKLGIWKLLGRIRESKTASIIITTHFLQEADALCSRIGIMAGGRMRVLGNQLTLKSKFGSGYFVHMQVPVIVTEQPGQSLQHLALAAENSALDRIEQQFAAHLGVDQQVVRVQHEHQEHLAEQRARGGILNAVDRSWEWEIKVKVPLPAASDLGAVFEFMASGQLGVVDWGVRQSSLEDVFVAVSTKYS